MSGYWAQSWPLWVSAFCVLAVYSYLFKDNALYRVMMQVFIGLNLGYQAVIQWQDVLYPQWWLPMVDGFHALFGGPGSPWGVLWSLVGVIGILFYLQLSRKYAPLSKIAIGITIGIGAGLTFKSQFGQNMPQVLDSFKPLGPSIIAPQPRLLVRLPGSTYPPAIDGSLGFFADGVRLSANELLNGVELWHVTLPFQPTGPVSVNGEVVQVPHDLVTLSFDRASGRELALHTLHSTHPPEPYPGVLPVAAVYRQPQFNHGVELTASTQLEARASKDGLAEGIRKGEVLWKAALPATATGVESFDGVALVSTARESDIYELPTPQGKLAAKDYFDNWVFVITVLCVMSYFFFSFKRRGPVVAASANVGRWLLMIGFGAFFGNTVMTRMSFLLDRLMFLIDDWLKPFFIHFFR